MPIRKIEAVRCECSKCGYAWDTFTIPKECPACQSVLWNGQPDMRTKEMRKLKEKK